MKIEKNKSTKTDKVLKKLEMKIEKKIILKVNKTHKMNFQCT